MIDVILLTFAGAVFYGGFWCGNRFSSLGEAAGAALNQCRDWLK